MITKTLVNKYVGFIIGFAQGCFFVKLDLQIYVSRTDCTSTKFCISVIQSFPSKI